MVGDATLAVVLDAGLAMLGRQQLLLVISEDNALGRVGFERLVRLLHRGLLHVGSHRVPHEHGQLFYRLIDELVVFLIDSGLQPLLEPPEDGQRLLVCHDIRRTRCVAGVQGPLDAVRRALG